VFLGACTATWTGLKVVVREAIGSHLYVSLVGCEAEFAHMVVVNVRRVVVINPLDLFCRVAQKNALPPFLRTGFYFLYWLIIFA
jgi:hypothetical protein